jgi:hypothetical protein
MLEGIAATFLAKIIEGTVSKICRHRLTGLLDDF